MIRIDHVCLGVRNLYEGFARLEQETGFGSYEGGWFRQAGVALRFMPLGNQQFIEIESLIDQTQAAASPVGTWFFEQFRDGIDTLMGWCVRVDSLAELEAVAERLGTEIQEGPPLTMIEGRVSAVARTPDAVVAWAQAIPNFFYYGEDPAAHFANHRVERRTREPDGIAWLELGGSRDDLADWIGPDIDEMPLRFNGNAPGLYAVAVNTADGEIVIRRRPVDTRTRDLLGL